MRISDLLGMLRDGVGSLRTESRQVLKLFSSAGREEAARAGEAFKDLLRSFYSEGGLTVTTMARDGATSDTAVMRTIIQPDGDLLSFVTPHCFDQPGCWQRHRAAILEKLDGFQSRVGQLKTMLTGFANLVSIVVFALGLYPVWQEGWIKTLIYMTMWSVAFVILRRLVVWAGLAWLRSRLPMPIRM